MEPGSGSSPPMHHQLPLSLCQPAIQQPLLQHGKNCMHSVTQACVIQAPVALVHMRCNLTMEFPFISIASSLKSHGSILS